jgi:hypothetical protein
MSGNTTSPEKRQQRSAQYALKRARRCPPSWRLFWLADNTQYVDYWHLASFRCAAKFGRYQCIADITRTSRGSAKHRYRSSPMHSATTITFRY